MQAVITENREKIAELCRAHHVRRLSVFGSAVRDDFDPERSEVDLLVDFVRAPEMHYAANFLPCRSLSSNSCGGR
jgi:predicted nucleotidyltransferase